jgi:hypothetical protein
VKYRVEPAVISLSPTEVGDPLDRWIPDFSQDPIILRLFHGTNINVLKAFHRFFYALIYVEDSGQLGNGDEVL